jgi:membrane-associated protease RseP (regulator of RpoE activity)
MTIFLYVVIVFIVLIFLVITHELGHFIAAKKAGVKVTEFFVGFGHRIWSTVRGETEYGIKWILAGGYVKILGMNPEEEIPPEDFHRSYKGVSYSKRFWIIISGSLAHVLMALIIMFFTFWLVGAPSPDRYTNTISGVEQYLDAEATQETPAYKAGLEPGDTIVAMNGRTVSDWDEVREFIVDRPEERVTLLIQRDGEEMEVEVRLAETEEGTGYLGVGPRADMEDYSFFGALRETGEWLGEASWGVAYSFYRVFNWSTIKQLIGLEEPTIERPVTVVGASRMAGQSLKYGTFFFLYFIAFILLFLAYINLLPLPPLDGGHLMVLIWERFTGREVDLRKLYPVALAVIMFFLIFFLLTLRLDITNPINLP